MKLIIEYENFNQFNIMFYCCRYKIFQNKLKENSQKKTSFKKKFE